MRILGLTGSIAMGKSTAAAMLRRMGVPVHDADAAVHKLTKAGGAALPAIRAAFPDLVGKAGLDRAALSKRAFDDPAVLQKLEQILHPLVLAEQARFLRRQCAGRQRLVALDIPLLLETGGDKRRTDTVASGDEVLGSGKRHGPTLRKKRCEASAATSSS